MCKIFATVLQGDKTGAFIIQCPYMVTQRCDEATSAKKQRNNAVTFDVIYVYEAQDSTSE